MSSQILDHEGKPAMHGRATVNGVRLHYVHGGSGAPLLLLHGVPKTSFYWHKLIPLLTPHYTVIAPDIRGFGDSGKPKGGYDMENIAEDIAQLMASLGHEKYKVHGEDWGAAFAYALTASYPERIEKLSYCEMLLPGFGLEDWSVLTSENVNSNHWLWHIVFFHVPEFPEFLVQGKEREFWSNWMKAECFDPAAISEDAVNEFIRCCSGPGGLRPIFDVYRATFKNIEFDKEKAKKKLTMPVLAIGSIHFIGEEVYRQAERVAENVKRASLDCGHSLALERPEELAKILREFMG